MKYGILLVKKNIVRWLKFFIKMQLFVYLYMI